MKRHGLITVCVLVCLIVTVSLSLSMLRSTLRARRDVAIRLQVQQTDWMLDAGIQLANARLAASEQYAGETWQVGDAILGYHAGRTVITVARDSENTTVKVVALLSNSSLPKQNTRNGERERGMVTQRSHQWQIKNL